MCWQTVAVAGGDGPSRPSTEASTRGANWLVKRKMGLLICSSLLRAGALAKCRRPSHTRQRNRQSEHDDALVGGGRVGVGGCTAAEEEPPQSTSTPPRQAAASQAGVSVVVLVLSVCGALWLVKPRRGLGKKCSAHSSVGSTHTHTPSQTQQQEGQKSPKKKITCRLQIKKTVLGSHSKGSVRI